MNPFVISLWVLAGVCAGTWIVSVITREYSWVDRIWSIVPFVYVWIFAGAAGLSDPRLNLMAILATVWGARLTFNFTRKGGYAPGGEDYRWPILRERMSPMQFQIFNVFFIVIFQNVILWLIAMPAYTAWLNPSPFGVADVIVAIAFLFFLTLETIADQQQWNFHKWKAAERAAGREPRPGFLTTGLFKFSRHPNFFSEQSQWWVFFLFGAVAAGSILQWTVVGAFLLTALFIGSTRFTEEISAAKYPDYVDYQRRTSALIPWFPRRASDVTAKA
jgi:steroid 5-alpha reductase family enzyme